ncbi:hypothetical protein E1091_07850 [Micromonospora fluostatini]|uniref:Phage tail protein n=1 Tax=Micromonospora fluostatini TaxID=1629071 RepID=A0ABY2DMX6_9ACTN|nr:hypothetical protein E1091_07850 [Micromonospora fluostatini]
MDISVTTEAWTVENRSWLGSRDGTPYTESITLHVPSFTANLHYPDGFIPSGILLAKYTSGPNVGLWGPYAGATSESQTVTITGSPTGGTFTLTFDGETTAGIAYNASAAAVKDALAALPGVTGNDITVTGGPGPGTPFVVGFKGQFAGENVPQMTASGSGLTGGSTPAVTVTTTTAGGSGNTSGLDVPEGFLWNSTHLRAGGAERIGAPLLWRGVIRVNRLPANSGLDEAARTALAAKFRFKG